METQQTMGTPSTGRQAETGVVNALSIKIIFIIATTVATLAGWGAIAVAHPQPSAAQRQTEMRVVVVTRSSS